MEKFWKYKSDHVLFWAITIGFHIYTRIYLIDQAGWVQFFLEIAVRNGLLALIIYVNFEILIPELAQRRKIFSYLAGLVLFLGLYVVAKNVHDVFLQGFLPGVNKSFWDFSFYNFSIALFYMAFAIALQLSKEWFFQREKLRLIEIEKLNTELEYLKLQINPHFLFNSLNTIYFQIDKSNAAARETLLKFSDMLRYPLYECDGKEVLLDKEIQYLRNFFDLQKLRKDENYAVKFDCVIQNGQQTLAPLLLVPFVENAFKHISHFPARPNEIRVNIRQDGGLLRLNVFNSKEEVTKPATHGGIGLKNVKRRLELIYKDEYSLNIHERANEFEVNLVIPLHEA